MKKTYLKGHIDVRKQEEWSPGALRLFLNLKFLKNFKEHVKKLPFD